LDGGQVFTKVSHFAKAAFVKHEHAIVIRAQRFVVIVVVAAARCEESGAD
jgi:hypothetical protein